MHLKALRSCATRVFFMLYSLATLINNRVQIFTGLLFYALLGYNKLAVLFFDNSQGCAVPLRSWKVLNHLSFYIPSAVEVSCKECIVSPASLRSASACSRISSTSTPSISRSSSTSSSFVSSSESSLSEPSKEEAWMVIFKDTVCRYDTFDMIYLAS